MVFKYKLQGWARCPWGREDVRPPQPSPAPLGQTPTWASGSQRTPTRYVNKVRTNDNWNFIIINFKLLNYVGLPFQIWLSLIQEGVLLKYKKFNPSCYRKDGQSKKVYLCDAWVPFILLGENLEEWPWFQLWYVPQLPWGIGCTERPS